MKNECLGMALLLSSFSAIAAKPVIFSNTKDTYKAVIQLSGVTGECTGTVVGLTPPTVITAKHCSGYSAVQYKGLVPEKIIEDDFEDAEFDNEQGKLPGDVSVLIYPASSEKVFRETISEGDLFSLAPHELQFKEKIRVCGFGSTSPSIYSSWIGTGTQRCGDNAVITERKDLHFGEEVSAFIALRESNPETPRPENFVANYIHTMMQDILSEYGPGTRYIIGGLTFADDGDSLGRYDVEGTQSLLNSGDSGGPFFILRNKESVLLGVNSATMAAGGAIFASVAWRLDHPWSTSLVKKAIEAGASIKGL